METVIYAIAVIGIINTIYLSYHAIRGTNVACWFLPDEWCEKVQHSKYSKTFGVKNPYLGFFMLTIILALSSMAFDGSIDFVYPFALMAFGFLFATYFMIVQAVLIRAFCTWCVLNFLVFTALFIAGLMHYM